MQGGPRPARSLRRAWADLPDPGLLDLKREAAVPVTVLTGFLGSGKTTLLGRALGRPALADTAVIVNEYGSVSLDHRLLRHSEDLTSVVSGGCLCCVPPGRLLAVMSDLMQRQYLGSIPPFRRLVIETSGLADPAPLLQGFAADPLRLSRYSVERVVAVVDATTPHAVLLSHDMAIRQIAAADCIALTKTDLVGAPAVQALRDLLADLTGEPLFDAADTDVGDLLFGLPCNGGRTIGRGRPEDVKQHSHSRSYADLSVELTEPLDPGVFQAWLDGVCVELGDRLLRLKGIVHLAGGAGTVEVHASGGRVSPLRTAPALVGSASQLVVIVDSMVASRVAVWLERLRNRDRVAPRSRQQHTSLPSAS